MNQRVVVTGGAGFIGSELVSQLAARGFDVVVVDNLVNGCRANLAHLDPARIHLVVDDVRNTDGMKATLQDADIVFHLACLGVRHSIHSPAENHDVNATGTLNLLSVARERHVGRFVYVSSSEVYGTGRTVPMAETHPTCPTTVYGGSKLAGESYARAFFSTYGFPAVIVRPFNAFGPRSHHEGDSGEVIPKFLLRALAGRPLVVFGDGTQTRDFTYVADTAAGILAAAFADAAIGETINLGSGRSVSITALAAMIGDLTGRPAEIAYEPARPGDVHDLRADVAKASALLRFEPAVPLAAGLRQLRDWYMSQGHSPAQLLEADVVRNWERV